MAFSVDTLLFRTSWYARLLEPDSSAAHVERMIAVERAKLSRSARYHAVSVGDSRMGFFARHGNERHGADGFRFGALSLGGALPRTWPYILRAVDPGADHYSAIIIPLNDYDDEESDEVWAERASDLFYLNGQLRLSDLPEFTRSYVGWQSRWRVLRAMLFKGYAYQKDVQTFLQQPQARFDKVELYKNWQHWSYDYKGEARSLAGLEVDPKTKTATFPAGMPAPVRNLVTRLLAATPIPRNGTMAAYNRYWLGKIVDRYRGSKTRLIFIRLPRVPLPLPIRPANPKSTVRQFAKEPHVTIVDEFHFDSLSQPDLFMDPWHLNGVGIERFSIELSNEVRRILTKS